MADFSSNFPTFFTLEYPDTFEGKKEPFCPVNDAKNDAVFAKYRVLAEGLKNIAFGGRLGHYRYYDMHQVIAMALKDAKKPSKRTANVLGKTSRVKPSSTKVMVSITLPNNINILTSWC